MAPEANLGCFFVNFSRVKILEVFNKKVKFLNESHDVTCH